jgi:cyanate permease
MDRTHPRRIRVVAAGIAMVATTFGLARYGYGLLLPDIRRSFGLSSTSLGLIAGMLADGVGLAAAFLAGGALIFACALLPPREELRAAVASSG